MAFKLETITQLNLIIAAGKIAESLLVLKTNVEEEDGVDAATKALEELINKATGTGRDTAGPSTLPIREQPAARTAGFCAIEGCPNRARYLGHCMTPHEPVAGRHYCQRCGQESGKHSATICRAGVFGQAAPKQWKERQNRS
jgi:hypothetical protein